MIRLYIDADSLPVRHRSIVLKRIVGKDFSAWFVADRSLGDVEKAIAEDKAVRRRAFRDTLTREEARRIGSEIHMVVVPSGANSADDKIVEIAEAPALAITHDIPLSERLIDKGITVIDDRGHEYSKENIRVRMSERDNNALLREMGIFTDKSKRFDERTIREFASAFDKAITALERSCGTP